jgi:hypothetical protein
MPGGPINDGHCEACALPTWHEWALGPSRFRLNSSDFCVCGANYYPAGPHAEARDARLRAIEQAAKREAKRQELEAARLEQIRREGEEWERQRRLEQDRLAAIEESERVKRLEEELLARRRAEEEERLKSMSDGEIRFSLLELD